MAAFLVFCASFTALAGNVPPIKECTALDNATLPQVLQLREAVQVDGEGVFLDQLFTPGFDLPRLRLCDSPAFSRTLVLKRAQLLQLAFVAGCDRGFTNWDGTDSIRISRRARPVSEKEGLQLLTSALQEQSVKELGELELHLSRPWATVQVPDEPFAFKVVDLPTTGVSPTVIARFEIVTAYGEHLGSWQASLQAKVWRDIWITRSAVKRGDSVRATDLVRERRDMLVCREPLAEISQEDAAIEFTETLQPGTPLWARSVRPRSIVHRGQSLAALVQDGALEIHLKVEALEDGAAGQIIRVRNPLSRRDLRGKVVDEQSILVAL
jgi:flagella basal body P-ring formation protein FlgA